MINFISKKVLLSVALFITLAAGDEENPIDKVPNFGGVDLSGYSFCAICRVEESGSGNDPTWYKFVPKKIYWGSHSNVENRLTESRARFSFKDKEERNSREYLILCADRDNTSGFSVFNCIPIKADGIDARSLGSNNPELMDKNKLLLLLSGWSLKMLPSHPLDKMKR